jgi:hypothetical protein
MSMPQTNCLERGPSPSAPLAFAYRVLACRALACRAFAYKPVAGKVCAGHVAVQLTGWHKGSMKFAEPRSAVALS